MSKVLSRLSLLLTAVDEPHFVYIWIRLHVWVAACQQQQHRRQPQPPRGLTCQSLWNISEESSLTQVSLISAQTQSPHKQGLFPIPSFWTKVDGELLVRFFLHIRTRNLCSKSKSQALLGPAQVFSLSKY
jgi:hypothetical protein